LERVKKTTNLAQKASLETASFNSMAKPIREDQSMSVLEKIMSIAKDFAVIIPIVKDIVLIASGAVAIYLGFRSFAQWRKQTIWQTKFEIAQRILHCARRIQAQFIAARSPVTFSGESAERDHAEDETLDEQQREDESYARWQRATPIQQTLQDLYQAAWEAELIMGEEITGLIEPFAQAYSELITALRIHFSPHADGLPPEKRIELLNKIYGGMSENDPLKTSVDEALENLRERLKIALRR
jgi:hypothetical protein